MIDFQSAGPDQGLMPYIDYKHCINEAIDLYKEAMFAYSDTQGLPSLRHELARQLQELQVFTERERIVVVTGSQQALHLLISLPFPNGKQTICVEQPTHPSMIESLRHQNARTAGIEIHRDGPDLSQLEHIFRTEDIKFFIPFHDFTIQQATVIQISKEKESLSSPKSMMYLLWKMTIWEIWTITKNKIRCLLSTHPEE